MSAIFERMGSSSQRALDLLFARCDADSACQTAFPNLRAEFHRLIDRLKSGPIETGVADSATGQPYKLDLISLEGAVHNALLASDKSEYLPLPACPRSLARSSTRARSRGSIPRASPAAESRCRISS